MKQSTKNKSYCIRCSKPLTEAEINEHTLICHKCDEDFSVFRAETSQNLKSKKFKIDGKELDFIRYQDVWVFPVITTYLSAVGSPIAILLYTENNGELEYYAGVTINIPDATRKAGCQFIDTNTTSISILYWLELNQFGKRTNRVAKVGFSSYPEFDFYCGEKFREYKRICDEFVQNDLF